MAHSDVAVHAHHGEGEDAREHVVVVDGNNKLAQDFSKWPGIHEVFSALEGQCAGGQGIGKSQVKDVDVCGRLHLGISDHPVHDKDVAQKSHHANDGVESRDGYGYDYTAGAPHWTLLLGVVLHPVTHQATLLVREGDIKGDDGVKVGQGELSSGDRVRLHAAALFTLSVVLKTCSHNNVKELNCLEWLKLVRLEARNGTNGVKDFPKKNVAESLCVKELRMLLSFAIQMEEKVAPQQL